MSNSNALSKFYENYDEDARLVRDNTHKVEFITTTWLLDRIIPPGSRILDVGAGTGRYAFHYVQEGHKVVAVDVVPKNVAKMKEKHRFLGAPGDVEFVVGDARNLHQFADESFDVVLCLGPVYHLKSAEDRAACITECLRVLKPEGTLAVAYINRFFVFADLVRYDLTCLSRTMIEQVVERGMIDGEDQGRFETLAHFSSPSEMETMMAGFGVRQIHHIGTDGISYILNTLVNGLSDSQFSTWLEFHFKTCGEPSIMGYSCHGLYVCKKPAPHPTLCR